MTGRLDRFQVDGIYPPMPRRSRPFDWQLWLCVGMAGAAAAALMFGAALLRFQP
jgi:hypothetical protein